MPKNRQQKVDALKDIEQVLEHKGIVMFNHQGLKMPQLDALRRNLRKEQLTLTVAKRNLLLLALKNKNIAFPSEQITGAVAVAAGEDEVMPAKVVADFKKTNEQVMFYGAVVDKAVMNADQVTNLAKLPSKPELLAKVIGSLQAPVSGFVNVLAGNLRGLVNVLNAVKDKKTA